MTRPGVRVALLALLAGGCLAAVPLADVRVGSSAAFLPAVVTAVVLADLLIAAVLAGQFLARGSAQLLGLTCAFLFGGLLGVAYGLALPGALTEDGLLGRAARSPDWLWAIWHAGLPIALAAARWGGPPEIRRTLADPVAHRQRIATVACATVAGVVGLIVWLLFGLDAALPSLTDADGPTRLARVGGPFVVAADVAAVALLARRGRRTMLERQLAIAAAAAAGATALGMLAGGRFTVGWYAAGALELLAVSVVLGTLLRDTGRLGQRGVRGPAALDPLTGALSRAAAIAALEQLHGDRRPGVPLAVALLDVDRLRAIGDEHGEMAADAVLLTVAGRLRACLRDEDVLGRSGDEGFLLVLPDTDAEGATLALDRTIAAIRDRPVGTWAHDVRTTASAGMAMVGESETGVADALAAADLALNQAKVSGRDQVVSPVRATIVPLRRATAAPPPQ